MSLADIMSKDSFCLDGLGRVFLYFKAEVHICFRVNMELCCLCRKNVYFAERCIKRYVWRESSEIRKRAYIGFRRLLFGEYAAWGRGVCE